VAEEDTIMLIRTAVLCATLTMAARPALSQPAALSNDRGAGLPTSMFGTFINKGELIVYPFFEAYVDDDYEYKPEELGYTGDTDYRGRYRANEGLLLVAYGLTDRIAVEFEIAGISATLDKAPDDPSSVPARIAESGLGDVEGQVRWRWNRESATRPEFFSFTEFVVPHAGEKPLIGTPGVEIKFGAGLVRGFSWGTVIARGSVEYEGGSTSQVDSGEYAVEYVRRLNRRFRIYAGIEGTQDEVSAIGELQWHLTPRVMIKANSGIGLTSKATDFAPEIGILFTIPIR
jgi:hypothetical protein